jgi:hypothetical protein
MKIRLKWDSLRIIVQLNRFILVKLYLLKILARTNSEVKKRILIRRWTQRGKKRKLNKSFDLLHSRI